jgi:hypothetical protein
MTEHAPGCTVLGCVDGCPSGQEKFDAAVLLVDGVDNDTERHCDGPNCPFGCGEADRNARFAEKVRERMATGLTVGLLVGLERDHFEVYERGPSEPKERKPVEPVKE